MGHNSGENEDHATRRNGGLFTSEQLAELEEIIREWRETSDLQALDTTEIVPSLLLIAREGLNNIRSARKGDETVVALLTSMHKTIVFLGLTVIALIVVLKI